MFCKNCGKELNEQAMFCNNCGISVGQVANGVTEDVCFKKEDNVLRLEVKPTFVLGYQIVLMIRDMILITLFCLLYWGEYALEIVTNSIFVKVMVILIPVFLVGRIFFRMVQYKTVSYRFLKTKVEYVDIFLNKEKKQLKYEHIKEVVVSQNIFERMFGLGRIRLYTSASGVYNKSKKYELIGKNGVDICCVVGVKEKSKMIKDIIDEIVD